MNLAEIRFDPLEARLFGVLVEKALTTPEQYPLSVNAATYGANQKSNRNPVLSLEEPEVHDVLERLAKRFLARQVFPGSGRVLKYVHNGKDALGLDTPQLAVVAELFLRGPQTAGELRTHVARMVPIESLEALMAILEPLRAGGVIERLPPQPGSRAERYVQLLCPGLHPVESPAATVAASAPAAESLAARVATLETEVARLAAEVAALKQT